MRTRHLVSLVLGAGLITGCGVKKNVRVDTPTDYVNARTAGRGELIELVNNRYASIRSVTVPKFKIQLTGGTIDDGELEKYRNAGGYLIAQRDDSIYVNILNPLSSTSVLTMASARDRFQVWIPSRKQFVTGATDAISDNPNPIYNVRPDHILQGLLIERLPIGDPSRLVTHYEDQDPVRKYYKVMVTDTTGELLRLLWIERSRMQLWRQQYYRDSVLVSDIRYETSAEVEGRLLGAIFTIDRPVEKYSVRIELDTSELTLDRAVAAGSFQIKEPAGAERITVPAVNR